MYVHVRFILKYHKCFLRNIVVVIIIIIIINLLYFYFYFLKGIAINILAIMMGMLFVSFDQ